jgi:hypothetical protein
MEAVIAAEAVAPTAAGGKMQQLRISLESSNSIK